MAIDSEKRGDPSFESRVLQNGVLLSFGYGIAPKSVLMAPSSVLSYESKACYLLLSSLSGKGDTAFPSQSVMMAMLCCGRAKLKSMLDPLVEHGYVRIKKQRSSSGMYASNVYCIDPNPPDSPDTPKRDDEGGTRLISLLRMDSSLSVLKQGYGYMPLAIFKDSRLGKNFLHAVALYGYILSFASKDGVAFPSVSAIQYHLGMSRVTYQTARKILIDNGYIFTRQRNWLAGGKGFGVNDIYVTDKLCFDKSEPENREGELSRHNKSTSVKSTTVESKPVQSTPVESTTAKSKPVNSYINNNSPKQKQKNINVISINPIQRRQPVWERGTDGREKSLDFQDYVKLISDRINLEEFLVMYKFGADEVREAVKMVALACCRRTSTMIQGAQISSETLKTAFLNDLTGEVFAYSLDQIQERSEQALIRNPSAYFVSTLFTAICSMGSDISNKVNYDLNNT